MVHFLRINLKFTAISLIGLTIGLSMLAAPLFQLDSTRIDYYYSVFEEFQDDLKIEILAGGSTSATTFDKVVELKEEIGLQISEHNLSDVIKIEKFYPYSDVGSLYYNNQTSAAGIYGINDIDESILEECVEGSRLPSRPNEVLVFVENSTTTPISLNEEFNVTRGFEGTKNFALTATGLLTPATLANNSFLDKIMRAYDQTGYVDCGFLTSLESSFNLAVSIQTALPHPGGFEVPLYCNVHYFYIFDFTAVTRENVFGIKENIIPLMGDLEWLPDYGSLWVSLEDNDLYLKYTIWNEFIKFDSFYVQFIISSIPILMTVGLLVSFSLGLVNEKRKKALALLKMRGASNRFVFFILFFETLLMTICSASIALLVGIPLSLVLGSSTGLLVFNRPTDPSKLVITFTALQSVFLLSGFLVFSLHFPSLVRLSRSTIMTLSEAAEKKRTSRFRVILGRFDVVFLTLGSAGVIIASVLIELLNSSPAGQQILSSLLPFFSLLLLVAPVFFLIGVISTFNRYIPLLIHKLSDFFWKRDWRVLAITARNLEANTNATKRTTLLIAATLALMVVLSIFSLSSQYYSVDSVHYRVGSEISLSVAANPFSLEIDVFNLLVADLKNVSGFAFTMVKELLLSNREPDGHPSYYNFFMGIEKNFTQFGHWQSYYAVESLETLVDTLFDSTENNSVIIDSATMTREGLTIGSSYNIEYNTKEIPVTIQAVAYYWPRIYYYKQGGDRFFITKSSYVETIANISNAGYTNTILGKILPNYDRTQVIATLKQIIRTWKNNDFIWIEDFQIIDEFDVLQEDNTITIFQWITVNTNLVAQLVIILSTIILFAFTRVLSHRDEIALSRTLGMKFPQLFSLMFAEPLLLFLLSGISGGILGGIIVMGLDPMFGQLYVGGGAPFILRIDFLLIIGFYTFTFLTTLFAGFITSVMVTRTNISKMLQVE
ncbi:MAG: FtsX-like permease family protein [Promethearchaeota archaeon]